MFPPEARRHRTVSMMEGVEGIQGIEGIEEQEAKELDAKRTRRLPRVNRVLFKQEDTECSICKEVIATPCEFKCGHVFDTICATKIWESESKQCPVCRVGIEVPPTLLPDDHPLQRKLQQVDWKTEYIKLQKQTEASNLADIEAKKRDKDLKKDALTRVVQAHIAAQIFEDQEDDYKEVSFDIYDILQPLLNTSFCPVIIPIAPKIPKTDKVSGDHITITSMSLFPDEQFASFTLSFRDLPLKTFTPWVVNKDLSLEKVGLWENTNIYRTSSPIFHAENHTIVLIQRN